jgi:dihydrofolate reductase
MAISVDGYIALKNDETPWSDSSWKKFISKVDDAQNLVIGRRTYEIMKEDGFEIFSNLKELYVVSSTKINDSKVNTVTDPGLAISQLSRKGFKEVIFAGGTQLNQSVLENELIDELHLDIEPVILGSGIRLFEKDVSTFSLKIITNELIPDNVLHLEYEVVK